MAILVFPRFLSLADCSPNPFNRPRTRLHCSSLAATSTSSSRARTESSPGEETTGAAVLWFKHDLRVDDHPGLEAASRFRTVVPLYVFDRRILSRFSDEMLELLLFALEDLRKSLKDQGFDLLIRFGTAENVIQELVKEVVAHLVLLTVIFNWPGQE
ncbi:hypothetical protein U1Q18_047022 [Sarracenia purpurea var. burkii]